METALELHRVTVAYGSQVALRNITAALPRGQISAIVGPNGSGKSTLLKAVVELCPLREGRITVLGRSFRQNRRQVAYVPQQDEIDWHYPVLASEVVAMGRFRPHALWHRPAAADRRAIEEAMEKLGLKELAHRPIGKLSGGQRQRVFLARALAQEAELYLLDEPFNGVDARTEQVIMEHLRKLKKTGKTVVVVHHKTGEVAGYFDRVLLLNGVLVSCGPTEEAFTPEALRAAYGRLPAAETCEGKEEAPCLAG